MTVEIRSKEVRLVPIADIKLNPKNRNRHSEEQVDRLVKIIQYQGFRNPLTISNQTGLCVAGEGRYLAAKKLKLKELPCIFEDFDSQDQEVAHGISDNAIQGQWMDLDFSGINVDVGDLGPDFDIDLLGIKNLTIEVADKEGLTDEDEIPEHVEPKTKLGDIYKLGNHRLMCGNSTSIDAVEKLMDGERANITFTSPPYNAGKQGFLDNLSKQKYQDGGDARSDDEFLVLLRDFTALCIEFSDFVFVNLQLLSHNRIPLIEYQHEFKTMLKDIFVWNKRQCPPNIVKGAFNTKWEYIFCFSKELAESRGFPVDWRGQYPNVVETESNSGNEFADVHKAGFPVAFPTWFIDKFDFAKLVLDPFGGTGTTMIACEKLNRHCRMMELSPSYCDIIVARWEKFTGQTAELLTRLDHDEVASG